MEKVVDKDRRVKVGKLRVTVAAMVICVGVVVLVSVGVMGTSGEGVAILVRETGVRVRDMVNFSVGDNVNERFVTVASPDEDGL